MKAPQQIEMSGSIPLGIPRIFSSRDNSLDNFPSRGRELGGSIRVYSTLDSADSVEADIITYNAKKVNTDIYLDRGFIEAKDLNPHTGLFEDEYTDRSDYFFVENGTTDAGARLIRTGDDGLFSLPTFKKFVCDPAAIISAAGVRKLHEINPDSVVEVSGLASRAKKSSESTISGHLNAVTVLYGSMLRASLERGDKLWVQNIEKFMVRSLKGLIGDDQITIAGESKQYMGPPTIPVILNPENIVRKILSPETPDDDKSKVHLLEVFEGINVDKMPKDIRKLLAENNVTTTQSSVANRILKSKHTIPQLAIGGYSAARAVPASFVDEFSGSITTLWAIDVGTSVPYTWGIVKALTGKTAKERAIGASVAVPSFLAPYAYWYSQGEEYPGYVNGVVAGFVGVAAISEAVKRYKGSKYDKNVSKQISHEK